MSLHLAQSYTFYALQGIRLQFNMLQTEACVYDRLEVYLEDEDGPLYGTYCGEVIPPAVTVPATSIYLRFITDASVVYSGFSLSFRGVGDGGIVFYYT